MSKPGSRYWCATWSLRRFHLFAARLAGSRKKDPGGAEEALERREPSIPRETGIISDRHRTEELSQCSIADDDSRFCF